MKARLFNSERENKRYSIPGPERDRHRDRERGEALTLAAARFNSLLAAGLAARIIARKRSANSHTVPGSTDSRRVCPGYRAGQQAAGRDRRQRPVTNYILLAQSRPRVHLRPGPRPIAPRSRSEPPSPSFFLFSLAPETFWDEFGKNSHDIYICIYVYVSRDSIKDRIMIIIAIIIKFWNINEIDTHKIRSRME